MSTWKRTLALLPSVGDIVVNYVPQAGSLAMSGSETRSILTHLQEIETWVSALGHYDNNEFEEALRIFDNISDTSKILFNCGVIHATLGVHEKAVRDICLNHSGPREANF